MPDIESNHKGARLAYRQPNKYMRFIVFIAGKNVRGIPGWNNFGIHFNLYKFVPFGYNLKILC